MALNPALRKAAILVSALDGPAADRLLEQMGSEQAARVRAAVMQLDDVDREEEEAILAEFFGHDGQQPGSDGVELHVSEASQQASREAPQPTKPALPRFHFLHAAASGELARRLRSEHPQLIALVTAHLPAEKSAEFLEHLPAALQDEVIERLRQAEEADPEVVAELERGLERMFAHATRATEGPRHDHLQAILGILRRKAQPAVARLQPKASDSWETIPIESPRITHKPVAPAARVSFDQLALLADDDFFGVLDEADPRIVMLALAGAPRRMFERYLTQFSRDRAIEFERHVEQLRPLRLRDVEAAQQELATLAGRRLASAKTAAEHSRRFAAAA